MGKHLTDDVPGAGPRSTTADGEERSVPITAEIVTARDGTAECTLFPTDASGIELTTTWITAGEGSFVSREEMR